MGEKYVQEEFLGEESLSEKCGENRGGWDAGFRSPLLRYYCGKMGMYSHSTRKGFSSAILRTRQGHHAVQDAMTFVGGALEPKKRFASSGEPSRSKPCRVSFPIRGRLGPFMECLPRLNEQLVNDDKRGI